MASLPEYEHLDEKRKIFKNGYDKNFVIDTKDALDELLNEFSKKNNILANNSATALIYRGLSEAKYKHFTSLQRIWITNEIQQWGNMSYLELTDKMLSIANKEPLIEKVFELYYYQKSDRDFPILSLLQHYGAPTPLLDWTYNKNVALYFATENIIRANCSNKSIDDYFSVYKIDKNDNLRELLNIIDFDDKLKISDIPSLSDPNNLGSPNANLTFYISDFEDRKASYDLSVQTSILMIRRNKPLTTVFNQNIIPQEGLFIFNPYATKALEDLFNINLNDEGWNLNLQPFECYNIHKDLADYLRRKICVENNFRKSYIYPNLVEVAGIIKEATFNFLVK